MTLAMKIAAFLLSACVAFATTQEREKLVWERTYTGLREDAFSESHGRPVPRVRPKEWPAFDQIQQLKGYHVDLRITDGVLWIDHIAFENGKSPETILGVTVPASGLAARWFSGKVGRAIWRADSAPFRIWSHERVFEFKDGSLVRLFERQSIV